ncbi:hypothetical protein J6TS7_61590 [Paenibacillus dendritiformis]|nr:hypothetical protein J6TS7_61590 [Paenibacillus dendritiformis]
MEISEPAVAKALFELQVNKARINNGGRAFARNVKRVLEEEHRSNRTDVSWFHANDR